MNKLQYEIIEFLVNTLPSQDNYADKSISDIFMTKSKDMKCLYVSVCLASKIKHNLQKRAQWIINSDEYNFSKAKELKRLMSELDNSIKDWRL